MKTYNEVQNEINELLDEIKFLKLRLKAKLGLLKSLVILKQTLKKKERKINKYDYI